MAPKKQLARVSPKRKLVQWRGQFYSRRDLINIMLGSFGFAAFSRRVLAVPFPFNFLKGTQHGSMISTVTGGPWTVPFGVSSITVEVWGGGGGGGANVNGSCLGGRGNPGGYASQVIAVSPGQSFNWTIGNGGGVSASGGTTTCSRASPAVSASAAGGAPGANASWWRRYSYYTTTSPGFSYRFLGFFTGYQSASYLRWVYVYVPPVTTGHVRYAGRGYFCPNGAAGSGAIGSGGTPGGSGVGGQVKITW